MPIDDFAPAKVNLTLHVTGRRGDGYHLLDSLVVFAGVGDRVRVAHASTLSLEVTGPEAAALDGEADNLVVRAARFLAPERGARIVLEKSLPVASGIGGGSSDAAAALRALARLWGLPSPQPAATARLGADVPVCMEPAPRRMSGIGERLGPAMTLPDVWLLLVNPRTAVPTAEVFRRLARPDNAAMPESLPAFADPAALGAFVRACRNDLEGPATAAAPVIADVLRAIGAMSGSLVARMSGSGATCFGLFAAAASAQAAAAAIAKAEPGWWVRAAPMLPAV
jgi:4-diphosphocytidyl-2-C-methyl-D-erythritol kinase